MEELKQALIDADILLYEIGYAVEKATGTIPNFDYVSETVDNRIANICALAGATQSPILFLTGKGNFRYEIAKTKPYKLRPDNKPFHYKNIKAYLKGKYDVRWQDGLEADDLISLYQTNADEDTTIICSRDKDLRAVRGWHYGWENGNQPSFGPKYVTELGELLYKPESGKLSGTGSLFFYAQCLMGDATDNIPGIPRMGAAKAFKILDGTQDTKEAFKRVLEAYIVFYGEEKASEMLLEQGRLLHMTRELNEDGSPKLWEFP